MPVRPAVRRAAPSIGGPHLRYLPFPFAAGVRHREAPRLPGAGTVPGMARRRARPEVRARRPDRLWPANGRKKLDAAIRPDKPEAEAVAGRQDASVSGVKRYIEGQVAGDVSLCARFHARRRDADLRSRGNRRLQSGRRYVARHLRTVSALTAVLGEASGTKVKAERESDRCDTRDDSPLSKTSYVFLNGTPARQRGQSSGG